MNLRTMRAKLATLAVLFFVGTFAGQIRHVLDSVRGKVEAGRQISDEIRSTVTTLGEAVDGALEVVGQTTGDLTNQVADLQAKLASGTATPAQVGELRGLLEQVKTAAGRPGAPGPAGPAGPPGPPVSTSPGPAPSTTSTTAGGTTSTTRPPMSTTTTRPTSTTTTTRCTAGVGRLIRIGC